MKYDPHHYLPGASRAVLEDVLDALKDAALGRHDGPRSRPPGDGDGAGAANDGAKIGTNANGSSSASGGGPGGEPDAETRRNAVRSLVSLCEEVGVGELLHRGKAGLNGSDNGTTTSSSSGSGNSQGQPPEGGGGGSSAKPSTSPATTDGLGEGAGPAAEAGEKSGGSVGQDGSRPGSGGWCPVALTGTDVEGVLATLLAAAEDYSVDKRGDVGSWCRVDALTGMERVLRLASKASRGLPLANRGESCTAVVGSERTTRASRRAWVGWVGDGLGWVGDWDGVHSFACGVVMMDGMLCVGLVWF